ncbi:MAG: ImmA/IrrE family metallo-endopeptidase [Subdoligranulum sp.]|nr:ImmA/IrrE family metallo-endopeptidase [Subdoligranulum sp.]
MEEIDAKVASLLKDYGYNEQVDDWVDVVRFARRKGFVVGNAELHNGDDGFIVIQPYQEKQTRFGPMVIGVNSERTKRFKRFVIGHELGHWQLHYSEGTLFRHRDGDRDRSKDENQQEAEADYFAAALLMPTESFRRRRDEMRELGLSRSEICIRLSQIYDVPLESVLRREEELDELAS